MPVTLSSPISPNASSGFPTSQRTDASRTSCTSQSDSMNHSPFASADGHAVPNPALWRASLTPQGDKVSASRQANNGSAAPSFVDGGKNDYFGRTPLAPGSPLEPFQEEDSIIAASSPISPPRTATVVSTDGKMYEQDRRVVVIDISAMQPVIQAGNGDAPMGFVLAVKDIKRAGHPVHVLTTLSVTEDAIVREWLHSIDLSVGFGSDNEVAALWHVPAGDDGAKIGVVRAVNAAFCCAAAKQTDIPLVKLAKEGGLDKCFAVQVDTDNDTSTGTTEGHFTPLHGPSISERSAVCPVQGWMNLGACLAEYKQEGYRFNKQKKE